LDILSFSTVPSLLVLLLLLMLLLVLLVLLVGWRLMLMRMLVGVPCVPLCVPAHGLHICLLLLLLKALVRVLLLLLLLVELLAVVLLLLVMLLLNWRSHAVKGELLVQIAAKAWWWATKAAT
jgi:hypothetical protein